MKTPLTALLLLFIGLLAACTKQNEPAPSTSQVTAKHYPLKGVIVDIRAEQSSLLVKHEAIPGYMMAMTMPFKVDAATLARLKKGDAITATLIPRGEDLWLEEVKITNAAAGAPL